MGRESRRYRIFVLGAGFSRSAGLPLADQLWHEVRDKAKSLSGRAVKFWEDLEAYVQFRRDCGENADSHDQVNFEDFMAFLDIEHYLGLRGSDTYSPDGNESQIVVKTLIAQVLTEATPPMGRLPDLYIRFAKLLQPNDLILTFNYDVLLERALETIGKPYRLFPHRFQDVRPEVAVVDTSHEETIILKLHGSIDWFDRTQYTKSEPFYRKHGCSRDPNPVFTNMAELQVLPLLDGPSFPNDPLCEMYRVRQIDRLYQEASPLSCSPWLLNPSSAKMLYSRPLRDFWYGLGDVGARNFGLAIIGFSLAPHDDYTRQAMYRIVKNYQGYCWDEEFSGLRKSPLVLVDKTESIGKEEEFRRRYAFVDWDKAITYMGGFDENAIDAIFGREQD